MCAPSSGGTTKIGYAADWSEYNNHQTGDAAARCCFNLDPLWSDANIDFIGIDNYMPLADWRDGTAHLDYDAVTGRPTFTIPIISRPTSRAARITTGTMPIEADRDAQTRTPITDGA